MIGNDGREPGADLLAEMIGALVEGAAPRGVPTVPEANLPLVRRAVRVRRVVKAGGVTAASLAVAGVLAIAATALPDRTTPIPPATPSASPTPSDTGLAIVDGHVPPGWEGSGLSCGMPTADLPGEVDLLQLVGPVTTIDFRGTPIMAEWRWPVRTEIDDATLSLADPVAVWTQDGRVVGLGAPGEPVWQTVQGGQTGTVSGAAVSTCAPPAVAGGTAPPLPPGSYEAVAFREIQAAQGSDARSFLRSDPVPIVVGSDGRGRTPGEPVEASVTLVLPEASYYVVARSWVDRTGHLWDATELQTQYITDLSTLTLRGRCTATHPENQMIYTVVDGSTSAQLAWGEVPCDGTKVEVPVQVPVVQGTSGRLVAVRLDPPPDVARAWATLGRSG